VPVLQNTNKILKVLNIGKFRYPICGLLALLGSTMMLLSISLVNSFANLENISDIRVIIKIPANMVKRPRTEKVGRAVSILMVVNFAGSDI
jgi:hypothetical protein